MEIAIETGIAMPPKPVKGGKYPFAKMQVGDSFVCGLDGRASWAFIFSAISEAQKKHGIELTTRLLGDGNRRIWRTA